MNGLFSGAEIAILSVRRTRLAELAEAGSSRARTVLGLRGDPERFLATVQVGITVVGAAAAAFSGRALADRLAIPIRQIPTLADHAGAISLAIVVAGVSYLSLVLGELVPKSLALRAAEAYALVVGPPMAALAWVGRPLVWFLTASSNLVLRLFGDRTSFTEARLSSDELAQLVDEAATAGTVDPHVGEIASRALTFDALDLSVVMVPRAEVVALPRTATIDDLAEVTCRSGHARVLIHDGDLDGIIGYVNVRDVLARARATADLTLESMLHPALYLADTMPAPAGLREIQRQRATLAVVVDEQGTVRGIVTIEDLLEELVGEILSEGEVEPSRIRHEDDGMIWVDGATPVHEVNRQLGVELPEPEWAATIGGLAIELAGRIPVQGDEIAVDGWVLEVVEASHRRVTAVRLRPASREVAHPSLSP